MPIARFENVTVNQLSFGQDSYGEQSTTITKKFTTRARVEDVANSLKISEKYRLYQDLVNLTLNYTPFVKDMVDNQNLYSLIWRRADWRITDCRESNDRMTVKFVCYRNDPGVAV